MNEQMTALRKRLRAQLPDVIADLRAKAQDHDAKPHREAGYTIHNAAGDEAVVRIYDEIWWLGVNAEDLSRDLDDITAPNIRVEINSPGGDVFDGIAIYNALRLHPAKVTTRIDGLAASIASVIAQAGDHRIMVASSQMMIHNAWGMTIGDRTDHEDMSGLLGQQDEVIAGIYASRSGKTADHFRALMDAETWLTDERAVAEGLADEIFTPTKAEDRGPTLTDKITSAASVTSAAMSDVEQFVAAHADAGAALTGAKRDGLVAIRDLGTKAADLLSPHSEDGANEGPPKVVDLELAAKKRDLAKRENDYRASVPGHFLA